ncbi:hypothetical protein K402DRAFT_416913 [Aulographum hederae CBS 113979]|uniref:Uncharacterized protein n=1 Tax=Aulographum hederae CBS 113979 TaxID=1176131 RepID=A0A6G1HEI2_9PEZI|nr:hypothetical protein K402DRAFT_416913 [Aulographum hederae CBS 113979]
MQPSVPPRPFPSQGRFVNHTPHVSEPSDTSQELPPAYKFPAAFPSSDMLPLELLDTDMDSSTTVSSNCHAKPTHLSIDCSASDMSGSTSRRSSISSSLRAYSLSERLQRLNPFSRPRPQSWVSIRNSSSGQSELRTPRSFAPPRNSRDSEASTTTAFPAYPAFSSTWSSPPKEQAKKYLPDREPSYELAYCLQNTGPPPRGSGKMGRKLIKQKGSGLRLFRRRRVLESPTEGVGREVPVTPPGVVQKVSKDGKRYFQIVGGQATQPLNINEEDISSSKRDSKRKSVTFSDTAEIVGADALDTWISTIGIHQDPWDEKEMSDEYIAREGTSNGNVRYRNTGPWLSPVADHGYSLAIIDEPDIEDTCAGADNPNSALGGNPPTPRPNVGMENVSEERDVDILQASQEEFRPSFEHDRPQCPPYEFPTKVKRNSADRLAGQGLRRPYQSHGNNTSLAQGNASPSDLNPKSNHSHNISDPATSPPSPPLSSTTMDPPSRPESQLSAPISFNRSNSAARQARSERARARKLRDLETQRSYRLSGTPEDGNDNGSVKQSSNHNRNQDHKLTSKPLKASHRLKSRPSQLNLANAKPNAAQAHTGYTPRTGQTCLQLSPIMLVAEQVPVRRGRQIRESARLILREGRSASDENVSSSAQQSLVAVQSWDAMTPDLTASAAKDGLMNFQEPDYDHHSRQHHYHQRKETATTINTTASATTAFPTPTALTFPSSHSAPTAASSTSTSTPTPILQPSSSAPSLRSHHLHHNHTNNPIQPSHIPTRSTPTKSSPRSHNSSLNLSNADALQRLEARLEIAERENKLLEAALMAVLKTGGRLNGCPCSVVGGGKVGDGRGFGEEVVVGEKKALECYLETRGKGGSATATATANANANANTNGVCNT